MADEEALDVLPARDSPGQTFKTLAQKKSYDSYGELPKKSPGRPAAAAAGPRSKIDRKSTEFKTSNSKSRESWSTVQSSPKLPPGISVEELSSQAFQSQENLKWEASKKTKEASWISPGPEAPEAEDHPSDDSIDDLIRSSSDSGKNWAGLGVSVMLVIVCDLFVFLFDR